MHVEDWTLDRVKPYTGNPRIISEQAIDAVAESIKQYGFRVPLIVDGGGVIIAGHTRLQAAQRLGLARIPVHVADDLTPDQVRALRIADNRVAEFTEWDAAALEREMLGLEQLFTGFKSDDIDRMLADVTMDAMPAGDADGAPDLNDEVLSRVGEVYELGEHRLLCGDSTRSDHVAHLLRGEKINAVWTDPPYGVSYVGKTKDALTIQNDDLDEGKLETLLRESLTAVKQHCAAGAAWYVAAPGGPLFHTFGSVLHELEIWRHTLIWIKDQFVLGRTDYHYRHEPIFVGEGGCEPADSDMICYGWANGRRTWRGGRKQDTCIEIPRPRRSKDHPTMKPVDLVRRCLAASTKPGMVVCDPFGGSGTTLIATAKVKCRALLLELSPAYCDVIRRRWGTFAVENAIDPGTGAL